MEGRAHKKGNGGTQKKNNKLKRNPANTTGIAPTDSWFVEQIRILNHCDLLNDIQEASLKKALDKGMGKFAVELINTLHGLAKAREKQFTKAGKKEMNRRSLLVMGVLYEPMTFKQIQAHTMLESRKLKSVLARLKNKGLVDNSLSCRKYVLTEKGKRYESTVFEQRDWTVSAKNHETF